MTRPSPDSVTADQAPTSVAVVWSLLQSPNSAPEAVELDAVHFLRASVERAACRVARRGLELDDIIQEALASTIRFARLGGPPPDNLDGFLYYRVLHVLKKLIREGRRQVTLDPEQIAVLSDVIVRPTAALEEEEQQRALADCVRKLTVASAAVWHRTYDARMEHAAAAEDLGIDTNALCVRLHRARLAVFECLKRKGVLEP